MRADLRQLMTFVIVAETGSLARASERLHLTQAALSLQLKNLQTTMGVTLLARTGRGLSLTEDGERLLPYAKEAVSAAAMIDQAAGILAGAAADAYTPVSIGTILDPAFLRLGEFLRITSSTLPHCRTELRHGISGWVKREVKAARLDVGFYLGDLEELTFERMALAKVTYVVIAPRGWGHIANRSWAELATLPWIGTPPDSVHHRLLAPLFKDHGVKLHTVARVDQEASMLELVRAGVGLSLAREDLAIKDAHLSGLAVSRQHRLTTDLSVIALKARSHERQIQALFQALKMVWPD